MSGIDWGISARRDGGRLRLVILRHADAERLSTTGRDADRVLSGHGHQQALWIAQELSSRSDSRPTAVRSSPAPRARQTAEALAEACSLDVEIEPLLGLESPASSIISAVSESGTDHVLCIVGHNDALSAVVDVLVQGPTAQGAPLRTGEACVLEIREDHAIEPGCAQEIERLRMPG